MAARQTMTDVAYDCLSKRKREIDFIKLWNETSKILEIPEEKLKRKKAQFYSELTLDSRFALLENNKWDLKKRRKFEEFNVNKEDIELDDDDMEEFLDHSGFDLPTGEDAFDN